MIQGYVKHEEDAAEVCQEAFIRAYRAIHSFRGDSSFYTWLYRIAVNCAKNFLRAKGSSLQLSDNERDDQCVQELPVSHSNPEKMILTDEVMNKVKHAMSSMPKELEQVIRLRELEGLSYEEIAIQAACPVGTVRSRIFRARTMIEKHVAPLLKPTS